MKTQGRVVDMPTRRNRTAACAVGVVAGALMLGACGGAGSGSGQASTSGSAGASSAAGPVTIEYVHRLPDGDGMVKVADIVKKWNSAHPDIQVKTTKFDGKASELITKLEKDVQAGKAPCLAQVGYSEAPTMFAKGFTEDVTAQAAKYKDHFSAGAFAAMTVGGKTIGLPQDTGPMVYYYNKAEFAKLGIQAPKNLDEFKAAAKKAAAKGKYISAFEPDEGLMFMSAQAAAAGAKWYSNDGGKWKVDANSAASKTVADFWQSMLDDKTTLVAERWGDAFGKALNDQKLIGTIGAGWEAPLLSDTMKGTKNAGQWAVAQLPDYGKGQVTGPDGGSGVAVLKGCKYADQAMQFNDWFNTQVSDLVSQGLVVAATTDSMKTPDALKAFYGGQDVFAELGQANKNLSADFTYIPFFPSIGDGVVKAAGAAGEGKGKVADIFAAAQDGSIKALKDGGLPVEG